MNSIRRFRERRTNPEALLSFISYPGQSTTVPGCPLARWIRRPLCSWYMMFGIIGKSTKIPLFWSIAGYIIFCLNFFNSTYPKLSILFLWCLQYCFFHNLYFSSGAGRTGAFIAIDTLLQRLEAGAEEISVFDTVLELRRHRPHMVYTRMQYHYIYTCLACAIRKNTYPIRRKYSSRPFCHLSNFIFMHFYAGIGSRILRIF